jgi:predicted Zn-dependent protease
MKAFLLMLSIGSLGFCAPEIMHVKSALSAYEAAQSAIRKNQTADAIVLLRKAIDIEPTFLEAREALSDQFMKAGSPSEAGAAMTQLLEIEPGATHYRVLLGQLLLKQKQAERALAQFSLVLRHEPENADALVGFATAAKEVGMNDRAIQALERGRKRYPFDDRFKAATTTANDRHP